MIRLQKYLAHAGAGSLRTCEQWIREGQVTVNGETVTQMGVHVDPEKDVIICRGTRILPRQTSVTVMLYKPEGYVTTARDQFGRPQVTDLIHEDGLRLYPVGRLDYQTSGLLLLSNDGDLTYGLTHPSYHIPRTYQARLKGRIPDEAVRALKTGVRLDDGGRTAPAEVRVLHRNSDSSLIELTIYEGKNHEVRRMAKAVHHPVLKLKRTGFAFLTLGSLKEGSYRRLSEEEVFSLYRLIEKMKSDNNRNGST